MIEPLDGPSYFDRQAYQVGRLKAAAAEEDGGVGNPAYNLSGLLYVSELAGKPWGLLSVPNAVVRGVFDAMQEPGIELPLLDGKLSAHITVFHPEELTQLGGADAIKNDRGKAFRYSLGRLVELTPAGWADVAKCWVLRIHSPELQALRRSLGLSGLPKGGDYDFHVTCAIRRKGVLGRNDVAKGTQAA